MMINLYEKLGIPPNATDEQINRAILRASEKQAITLEQVKLCRSWLLNAENRAKYDARLAEVYPDFFAPPPAPERSNRRQTVIRKKKRTEPAAAPDGGRLLLWILGSFVGLGVLIIAMAIALPAMQDYRARAAESKARKAAQAEVVQHPVSAQPSIPAQPPAPTAAPAIPQDVPQYDAAADLNQRMASAGYGTPSKREREIAFIRKYVPDFDKVKLSRMYYVGLPGLPLTICGQKGAVDAQGAYVEMPYEFMITNITENTNDIVVYTDSRESIFHPYHSELCGLGNPNRQYLPIVD